MSVSQISVFLATANAAGHVDHHVEGAVLVDERFDRRRIRDVDLRRRCANLVGGGEAGKERQVDADANHPAINRHAMQPWLRNFTARTSRSGSPHGQDVDLGQTNLFFQQFPIATLWPRPYYSLRLLLSNPSRRFKPC